MPFLVRKIRRARWEIDEDFGPEGIAADAVTGCLRTTENALSVWECAGGEKQEVRDAVLALAAAGERLDSFQVVAIERERLEAGGFTLSAVPGDTPVPDLIDSHRDIVRLELEKLGLLAHHIASTVRSGTRCHQFTKKELRDLITDAVKAERIHLDGLKPALRDEVNRKLSAP